jgi:hypothetical protein
VSRSDKYQFDPEPDDGLMFVSDADGRGPCWPHGDAPRCVARSRTRTNAARARGLIGPDETRRCRRPCKQGLTVCRWHGGAAIAKRTNGSVIEHGRSSKTLGKLGRAYEEALASPHLLDLREGLAMLDAVARRAFERADELDTPYYRKEILRLTQAAIDSEDPRKELDDLLEIATRGCAEDDSMRNVLVSVDRLQKRVEAAWNIKLTQDHAINVRDLVGILRGVMGFVFDEAGEEVGGKIEARVDTFLRGLGSARPIADADAT